MSRISDIRTSLKAQWRRFERWERIKVWYEEEWSFPVYGTAEEFEARFRFLLPTVSKTQFLKERYRWFDYRTFGYVENGEVGLKVANPFPYNLLMINTYFAVSSYFSFFGALVEADDGLRLVGSYRSPTAWQKFMLGGTNLFAGLGAILTLASAVWMLGLVVIGKPLIHIAEPIALMVFGVAMIILAFGSTYLMGAMHWLLDRGASLKAQELLAEVCGRAHQDFAK